MPYVGAPEPEAKPGEKPEEEQEAVPHGGAPEPEAKLEDNQQPADPREPPPARGDTLLTQKGGKPMGPEVVERGADVFGPMRYCRSTCPALMWLYGQAAVPCAFYAFCASALCVSLGTSGAASMFHVSCRMSVCPWYHVTFALPNVCIVQVLI